MTYPIVRDCKHCGGGYVIHDNGQTDWFSDHGTGGVCEKGDFEWCAIKAGKCPRCGELLPAPPFPTQPKPDWEAFIEAFETATFNWRSAVLSSLTPADFAAMISMALDGDSEERGELAKALANTGMGDGNRLHDFANWVKREERRAT